MASSGFLLIEICCTSGGHHWWRPFRPSKIECCSFWTPWYLDMLEIYWSRCAGKLGWLQKYVFFTEFDSKIDYLGRLSQFGKISFILNYDFWTGCLNKHQPTIKTIEELFLLFPCWFHWSPQGLSCAKYLVDAGHKPIVLEARDCLGHWVAICAMQVT